MLSYRWAVVPILATVAACGGTTVDQMTSPGAVKCQITLSAGTQDVPSSASQFTVDVTAARECAWTSQSSASWVQTTPSSGQGEATLTVNVGTNTQQSGRSATVTINDSGLTISQAAAPAPCTYTLAPANRSFSADGGTGTFAVQTGANCPWTASTNVSWIAISNPTGTGPATVIYVVERSQSHNSRTGTITVAGRTHVVTEAGR
jgi:hypothetical protein